MLLRQAGMRETGGDATTGEQVAPEKLAQLFVRYGAQIIFPFHHDVMVRKWGNEKTAQYFYHVAQEISKLDPSAMLVYPQSWKWYNVGIDVTAE